MRAHAHAPSPLTPPFPLTHAPAPPLFHPPPPPQTTPLIAGLTVGSAAYAAKLAIEAFAKYKAAPRLRAYYKVSEQEGWGGRVLAARALSLSDSIPPSIPLFPLSLSLSLQGGFLPEMTRREAALILGLRESAPQERVREAHRRIMIANHPDAGARWWWWREREKKKKKRGGWFFFSRSARALTLPLSPSPLLRRLLLPGHQGQRGQGHAAGQGQAGRQRVLKRDQRESRECVFFV